MLLQRWSKFSFLFCFILFYGLLSLGIKYFIFIFIILYYLFLVFEVKIVIIGTRNISQNILQNNFEYYSVEAYMLYVGKFRLRLIELISFKPQLLIRLIMTKNC